jgi:hypothetical protein
VHFCYPRSLPLHILLEHNMKTRNIPIVSYIATGKRLELCSGCSVDIRRL